MPITLGAISVALAGALLVGWSVILGRKIASADEIAGDVWLLVLGAISFAVIMAVLVMFSIYLVREILEVRRQDSFIDSVTHELKSPLASLKLCVETLGRDVLGERQREQLRQMMLHDVERLSSFIDDVLQSSRLSHESPAMDVSEVELASLARHCADAMGARHQVPEGAITMELPPSMVLHTDRAALEIVLKNLVDNAIKYSDAAVDVTVRAYHDPRGRAVLEVQDQGVGIPKADRKRVFNRFFRGTDAKVRRRRGTGLGLFVVSALVRNLGGRIEAVSDGPGCGTTMRVVLPAEARVEASPASRAPEVGGAP